MLDFINNIDNETFCVCHVTNVSKLRCAPFCTYFQCLLQFLDGGVEIRG